MLFERFFLSFSKKNLIKYCRNVWVYSVLASVTIYMITWGPRYWLLIPIGQITGLIDSLISFFIFYFFVEKIENILRLKPLYIRKIVYTFFSTILVCINFYLLRKYEFFMIDRFPLLEIVQCTASVFFIWKLDLNENGSDTILPFKINES